MQICLLELAFDELNFSDLIYLFAFQEDFFAFTSDHSLLRLDVTSSERLPCKPYVLSHILLIH